MACGTPVIAPRRGAHAELIDRAGGGILVAPDDPAALADGLRLVLSDNDRHDEMSRRGREYVLAEMTVEREGQAFLHVCEAIVARPAGAAERHAKSA
jgi:glycosyltransferase involved in cell wall biosynthesis